MYYLQCVLLSFQILKGPSEFGNLAAHIVDNTYLNGETIRIDSGMRMKPR